MKKNKLFMTFIALTIAGSLAGCAQSTEKDLVTMKGGTITVTEFFEGIRSEEFTKQQLTKKIIYAVANKGFGSKVTEKMIQNEFDKTKEQFGDSFDSKLKDNGLTKESLLEQIKGELAIQEMLKANIKITDDEKEEVWETFHPDVEAQIIQVDSMEAAEEVMTMLENGDEFSKLAEEKSIDVSTKSDDGKIIFNSSTTLIPENVRDEAFKLKDGELSDILKGVELTDVGSKTTFYIVKMIKNQERGSDINKYKNEITQIITTNRLEDPIFKSEVISAELKKADVRINDPKLKNILSGYLN